MIDEYGFERLDVEIEGLTHKYEVRWKLLPTTDRPPGAVRVGDEKPMTARPLETHLRCTTSPRRARGRAEWAESSL